MCKSTTDTSTMQCRCDEVAAVIAATGYRCPDITGNPVIRTIDEAKRYADVPAHHQYKCADCGHAQDIVPGVDYVNQRHCPQCGNPMMGGGWPGWYNRWRNLAMHLLAQ